MPHDDTAEHISAEGLAAQIPAGFLIGTATAAAQIEGAIDEPTRTSSVWDSFSSQPGRIVDGSTTAVTADHFHRRSEDVALMRDLGADAYRFSLGWTRLQPGGSGPLDAAGVSFYDRLLDELHEAGISPFVTLSHWDLPVEYEQGWLDRDTAHRFGEFAGLVAERFGDRVDAWITINEPATVTLNGYALGLHAPGRSLLFDALPTVHHQLLGHGLAVQALRAASVSGQVGISNAHTPVLPASDSEQDAAMALLFDVIHNRVFADPVLLGHYPEVPPEMADLFGAFSAVPAEDLDIISQPLDFYGLNYYMPSSVAAGAGTGESPDGVSEAMADLPFQLLPLDEYETTGFGWPIAPEYLGVVLGQLRDRYGDALPPVFITESGASFDDVAAADGSVSDPRRVDYVARHLSSALSAVTLGGPADGVDLRGFFVWSLLDNWEWAAGFTQRFGLVHVDFDTGQRTPKTSYRYLQNVFRQRRVT
ncbi:glycoside hydrolase family 1 protein [Paramicrobacterium chengjingii]|uniref:Family 1 glycosylhydrolase n=1 Tax=Paramicrobacterium chengjingii TaxID=2769067 RepID=A0ABX6YH79_9MICO|nr:family 1 glycosylhydrolase [Microbacterium chengjingii]QPZ38112.1 family 1 glycosylhydrolase [Microbacterium chengjingii]